jgi:hypothetical protein
MFDGPEYHPPRDRERLGKQYDRIMAVMTDGRWRTLAEIGEITGDPHASISAQLRHFRKKKFGSHIVLKRRRGDPARGLYEYSMLK